LQVLYLGGNQLTESPPEIGLLTNLQWLDLGGDQLTQLPPEIGHLTNLQLLTLGNSNLLTPPPEIVERGTRAILDFLQELQKNHAVRYEAKLLVVGEGGTGKSSLLRSLRNEVFNPYLPTTHGVEVDQLLLSHPKHPQTEITLNTWDFGGQHIYHATHQFFFTKRSLYVVVWSARLGAEPSRLHFWLETIKALAPDAPVLLVATYTDERASDLNYQLYKDAYPQLVGHFNVSNKNRVGLDTLKAALAHYAAEIRLMGQPWPLSWLEVEQRLLAHPEHYIDARTYTTYCAMSNIDIAIAMGTLGNYLHDLGKILYFRDDPVLSNLVVLKPNWVTKAISRVLTDEATREANGILSHIALPRIWASDDEGQPYEAHLYPVFLRLMERFDLSYQIDPERPGSPSTRSLVPQLLPHQPPANLPPWPKAPFDGQMQVEMRYRFDFVPAGIMSWFIVRTHQYTQNIHWREGVMLRYQDHQARVELNPMQREMRLVVWGVQPHNFFTILMNTLDLILDRFEGLHVQREIPCICHWRHSDAYVPCPSFYPYEYLVRRMEAGKHEVECRESFLSVSVPELLYGIHTSTNDQVIADIRQGQQQILHDLTILPEVTLLLKEMNQRSELIWRTLLRQWNFEMQNMEAECPNIFLLTLGSRKRFNPKNWVSQEYQLYLVCQHPLAPHPIGDSYKLREAKEWWVRMSPWFNHLFNFLKVALPIGKAIGDVYNMIDLDHVKNQIVLIEEIIQNIPELIKLNSLDNAVPHPVLNHNQQAMGVALRALYSFLNQADPQHIWRGLDKTVTPEGNIFWLCDIHRLQYEVKPLDQGYVR